MNKCLLITTFFYAMLAALLAMNIHGRARVDYTVYNDFYRLSNTELQRQNEDIRDAIQKQGRHKYRDSYPNILKKTEVITSHIDPLLQLVTSLMGTIVKSTDVDLPDKKSRKFIKYLFIDQHKADTLQHAIDTTLQMLLENVRESDSTAYGSLVRSIWWGHTEYWCRDLFAGATSSCTYALLGMLRNRILATEHLMLIEAFYSYHMASDHFDTIGCIITPRQDYVLENSPVAYDMCLAVIAPYLTQQSFAASEGAIVNVREHYRIAAGHWTGKAGGPGLHTVHGTDTLQTEDTCNVYPWSFSYYVTAPGASVSLDNMRAVYRGIANPVTLTVPGYTPDKLSLRVPGATIRKISAGHYELYIKDPATDSLTAYTYATNKGGVTSVVHIVKLKVKDLPAPVASINGKTNDTLTVNGFKQNCLLVISPADDDLKVDYRLEQYEFSILTRDKQFIGPIKSTDPGLKNNSEILMAINKLQPGDKVYISAISVSGAGRTHIHVPPVVIDIE